MQDLDKLYGYLKAELAIEHGVDDPILSAKRKACEESLFYFVKEFWHVIEGGEPFVTGIPTLIICAHLEELYYGRIRKLLINLPPRLGKSLLVSVFYPVWIWIKNPSERIMSASYSLEFSTRDAVRSRRLIEHPAFRALWGNKLKLYKDQNRKTRIENTSSGFRIATSVGSGNMAEGGSMVIIDDPNNSSTIESKLIRDSERHWFTSVMGTRSANPKTYRQVLIQQRLHMEDCSGWIIDNDDSWTKLILPMEYDPNRVCRTIPLSIANGAVWTDPRTVPGQLLWPERLGRDEIKDLKTRLGSYAYAGQYQQSPQPESGGIFDRNHFRWWKDPTPPTCELIVQAIDTALTTNALSCYSAICTVGMFKDPYDVWHCILLSLWYGQVEMPDLYYMSQRLANNYSDTDMHNPKGAGPQPDIILVEEKVNGSSLIQMMRRAGISVMGVRPKAGECKLTRARTITPVLESGRLWVPATPPTYSHLRSYSQKLVDSAAMFRGKESGGEGIADVIDAYVYAVRYAIQAGYLRHAHDDTPIMIPSFPKQDLYNIYNSTTYN